MTGTVQTTEGGSSPYNVQSLVTLAGGSFTVTVTFTLLLAAQHGTSWRIFTTGPEETHPLGSSDHRMFLDGGEKSFRS